jgi:hypothetical protein
VSAREQKGFDPVERVRVVGWPGHFYREGAPASPADVEISLLDTGHMRVSLSFTPAEARRVAAALVGAADYAESAPVLAEYDSAEGST